LMFTRLLRAAGAGKLQGADKKDPAARRKQPFRG